MLTAKELIDLHQQWNEYWKEELKQKRIKDTLFNSTLVCIRILFEKQKQTPKKCPYSKLTVRKGDCRFKKTLPLQEGVRQQTRGRPKKQP